MIQIQTMTLADLPLGLRLCRQAGWNQTEADWERFLYLQPDGCFVAQWNGTPAGTTVTVLFGQVAWIAMVLVDEPLRGRGIGKALLHHALDYLDRQKVKTVRLDATPLGLPLYRRLGFVEQFPLARYVGTIVPGEECSSSQETKPDWWQDPLGRAKGFRGRYFHRLDLWRDMVELDKRVTRTDRGRFLYRLFWENPVNLFSTWEGDRFGNRLKGFVAWRPGAQALQLGPCLAVPENGTEFLEDTLRLLRGQSVFLDIPVANEAATQVAASYGLTVQRHLTRMCRGVPLSERLDWLWASSGPEKG